LAAPLLRPDIPDDKIAATKSLVLVFPALPVTPMKATVEFFDRWRAARRKRYRIHTGCTSRVWKASRPRRKGITLSF
jgi:hypothetical protein